MKINIEFDEEQVARLLCLIGVFGPGPTETELRRRQRERDLGKVD